MENSDLVKDLKRSFDLLDPLNIEETIRSIARNVNRLKTGDKDTRLQLSKVAADLIKAYTNQVEYSKLRNSAENPGLEVKPVFDSSFFESLGILKEELFSLLKKL